MTESILAIETQELNFSYKKGFPTLRGICLRVPKGSIYGFLGPNGAGKTTTLKILLGLIRQQQAVVKIFGKDMRSDRLGILRKIGSLIEQPSLYGHLTGKENLEIARLSYNCAKDRISVVMEQTGIAYASNKKVKEYSLGMKQRLAIAITLLHQPDLIILDEPTNGLDPNGIIEIRELLKKLNQEHGITILLSSHLLPEVEKIVTDVGIINHGKVIFQGTLKELQQLQGHSRVLLAKVNDMPSALELLHDNYRFTAKEDKLEISVSGKEDVAAIARLLVEHKIAIYQLSLIENDLEDLFLQIINE